ncbi:MAG: ABC transporter permease subunit [Oscillospiraceae bacterium]|nr:ABC transporter permease subunit [Oscillospiraceae bacterium]
MLNKLTNKIPKPARLALALVFWLFVWQIVYMIIGSDIIFASPLSTFKRVFELAATLEFWKNCANSIFHVLFGFVAALIVSIPLAALTARFKFINLLFSPILKLIKATPVASFIVLALFWLKNGVVSFIAFLMVVPLVYSNLSEGFENMDKGLIEMAKVYKFSFIKKVRLIYIPSLMPYFVAACSVGLGFAWKAGIAAEVIALPGSTLGLEIYNAKIYIETVDLFALTVVIIVLSIIMEKAFMWLLKKLSQKILRGGGKNA